MPFRQFAQVADMAETYTVTRRQIPWHPYAPDRPLPLGRNVHHDSRSLAYPWQRRSGAPLVTILHSRRVPIFDQGDVGSCFPPGTRIRMADGSERPIEDVRLGEHVVTAEGNTGRVTRTMLRDETGGLVRMVAWGHSHLRMTREHPVLTGRGYVRAGELAIGDEVALPRYGAGWVQSIKPRELVRRHKVGSVMLPDKIELDAAFGRLFGLWLAEGSADGTKVRWHYGGHEGGTLVPETVNLIRSALGAEAHAAQRPNGTWWVTLYGVPWNALFKVLGGQRVESKRPHPLLCSGCDEFLTAMLDGWLAGDGHTRPDGTVEGLTVSPDLGLAMYDIGQAAGRHPVMLRSEPVMNSAARTRLPRWTITFAPGQGRCRQDERHVWRKVRELRVEDYVGPVYNLSVEGDESYVAEGVGVHNCTGNGEEGCLGTDPLFTELPPGTVLNEAGAVKIYSAAEKIDGGAGYPPEDEGSSGLSAAKAAKAMGLISGFVHCLSLADVLSALQTYPVSIGINWYSSFDEPPASGLLTISPGAGIRGGHEPMLRGVDVAAQTVFGDNSWSADWGVKGSFTMGWATLDRLLHEQGDGTVSLPLTAPAPVPVPVPTPAPTPVPPGEDEDEWLTGQLDPWAAERHIGANERAVRAYESWKAAKGL
jgi:hypothetical protein